MNREFKKIILAIMFFLVSTSRIYSQNTFFTSPNNTAMVVPPFNIISWIRKNAPKNYEWEKLIFNKKPSKIIASIAGYQFGFQVANWSYATVLKSDQQEDIAKNIKELIEFFDIDEGTLIVSINDIFDKVEELINEKSEDETRKVIIQKELYHEAENIRRKLTQYFTILDERIVHQIIFSVWLEVFYKAGLVVKEKYSRDISIVWIRNADFEHFINTLKAKELQSAKNLVQTLKKSIKVKLDSKGVEYIEKSSFENGIKLITSFQKNNYGLN